jgi:hypothetical protein
MVRLEYEKERGIKRYGKPNGSIVFPFFGLCLMLLLMLLLLLLSVLLLSVFIIEYSVGFSFLRCNTYSFVDT